MTEGLVELPPRADRHGPAGAAPAQSHPRRRLSRAAAVRHQVREAVASRGARPSRRDDGLRRPARRAGAVARARHLSRHRLCQLRRGDQSDPRRSMASAARASRRRTAPRCGSTPRRDRSAIPASPSRARAPRRWSRNASQSSFGVPIERVRVVIGDTDNTPYGGGTWASRAAGIGGEAAWQAGKALRENVLAVAGRILQADAGSARHPRRASWSTRPTAASASASTRSRASPISVPTRCRPASRPNSIATRHYVPRAWPFAFTNGVQASYVEVDIETGLRQAPQALVRRGLRHRHQSATRRRAGARRHRPGHRRRAVRELPLRRRAASC